MLQGLTKAQRARLERNVVASRLGRTCLWPDKFEDTAEGAFRFVLEQWTWNEAGGIAQQMPAMDYIEWYCYAWHDSFKAGRTMLTEKCRRMIISWTSRSLELHQMGLRQTDCLIAGEDFESAAKHVWRLKYLYKGMRQRHPEWHLPTWTEHRYEGDRKLKSFGLANASITSYANGNATGLQGDGVKIITLEELSRYRYAGSMLAQAKIITMGAADSAGGFVNAITNASSHHEWQQIKRGAAEGNRGRHAAERRSVSEDSPLC
jgi:hypothetical protein